VHQNSGWENYIYVPAFMAASHLNPFVLISSQSFYLKKKGKIVVSIYTLFGLISILVEQMYTFGLCFRKGNYKGNFR